VVTPDELARLDRIRARFERIAARLSHTDLRALKDPDQLLSAEDLHADAWRRGTYFLGYYSAAGLERGLRAYGLHDRLAARGWSDLQLELDLRDRSDQRLRLRGSGHGRDRVLLAEVIAHEGTVSLPPLVPGGDGAVPGELQVVVLEWMTLQSPGLPFPPSHPRLPGQRHPGLGVGAEVLELLYRMGLRLGKDALIAFPAYYHTAVLYRVRFSFVSPEDEGRLLAYCRDLGHLPLAEASWAFELGCVRDRTTGASVRWQGPELCMPLTASVARRFSDPRYWDLAWETAQATSVGVDLDELAARRREEQARFERERQGASGGSATGS
jgi:hypothetical protein